jgi:hypothetical protein
MSIKLFQIGLLNPWAFCAFSFLQQTQVQNKNNFIYFSLHLYFQNPKSFNKH